MFCLPAAGALGRVGVAGAGRVGGGSGGQHGVGQGGFKLITDLILRSILYRNVVYREKASDGNSI